MATKVLVTGGNGQLAQEIIRLAPQHFSLLHPSKEELDITDYFALQSYLQTHKPKVIFNTAAYTKVDDAENNYTAAYAVNDLAVANMLELMDEDTILIHYSTDYVYADLADKRPLTEDDPVDPQGIYAASKLAGDQRICGSDKKALVLRTSWVYSSFGHNFVKTMLRLAESRDELSVVNDQIGSPTYAADLAEASISIAEQLLTGTNHKEAYQQVYHYCNTGQISWHSLAEATFQIAEKEMTVHSIPSSEYPTPAKRPKWSVMDTSKIVDRFGVKIYPWKVSLERCIEKIKEK